MNKTKNEAIEFCNGMRQVLKELADIVQKKGGNKGSHFLTSYFNDSKDLFCQFLGFLQVEMKTTKYKKSVVTGIWIEVAQAGFTLGWSHGYADAKRIFSAA